MIATLIEAALRRRLVVLILVAAFVCSGVYAFRRQPVDAPSD
jgi:Cu/Ag efflux pump CusA